MVSDTCRILAGWKNQYGTRHNQFTEANDGMAFTIRDREEKKNSKEITCFKCKETGHYSNEYDEEAMVKASNKKGSSFQELNYDNYDSSSVEEGTTGGTMESNYKYDHEAVAKKERNSYDDEEEETTGEYDKEDNTESENDSYKVFTFLNQDVLCFIQEKSSIPRSWILMYSQSMVDVFCNPRLLSNIRDTKCTLTLHCNAVNAVVIQKAVLKGTIQYCSNHKAMQTYCFSIMSRRSAR